MPDPVGASQVVHQRNANQQVSKKSGQNRGSHDRVQPLDVENVDRRRQRESAGRQHYPAQNVEPDPDSPRKLIVQVRGTSQPLREANDRAVEPNRNQREENQLPESEFHLHCSLSLSPPVFSACGPSPSPPPSRPRP